MSHQRVIFKRFASEFPVAWVLRLSCAVACIAYPAFSEPVPIWTAFISENSDVQDDRIRALAVGADGALWVGTGGGLARLDKDGRWQTWS
jgi:hypothetical protein